MRRVCIVVLSLLLAAPAFAVKQVPPGNRNVEQPGVPGGSARRTAALSTTYENKYRKVLKLLQTDKALRQKIVQAARAYGIAPIHIAGAIVGEHTYNVDAYDRLQTYYVKATSYLGSSFAFKHDGQTVDRFVQRPEFAQCKAGDSYSLWTCREQVWNMKFAGKTVDGTKFPNDRFGAVFFQPFYAGQTFGLGQLNPLTALQMSDLVNRVSGLPKLDAAEPAKVYETIMDPDKTLPYVAATLKKSIDAYRRVGFDISNNPGLTATLYNVGSPEARASALKAENTKRQANGEAPRLPEENYYGWLVNDRIADLEALF
jgi:hypothetical protein